MESRRRPTRLSVVFPLVLLSVFAAATLGGSTVAQGAEGPESATLLVQFRGGASPAQRDAALAAAHGSRDARLERLEVDVIRVPQERAEAALAALRDSSSVAFAEADARAQLFDTVPNDPWWPNQWSQAKVRAPKAWDLTRGSRDVVVAVLDTGVDASQPDLQGSLVPGWNALGNNSNTADADGHGTLAAGVATARGNNGLGLASYCWSCSLMPVKVIETGGGSISSVSNGIVWATDHGARVISMSLGFSSSSSTLQSAVRYAHDRNVVLVAAAGNYGTTAAVYPAAYPEVLGVAGTDGNDSLYSWSSYGSRVKLAAPGCNFSTGTNAWYGTFCGTSSAAPALAGIAALAAALAPGATNAAIEQALTSSAVKIGSVVQFGRVDAYAALLALGAPASGASAPVNTVPPAISGLAQEGQAVTASAGTWSGSPTSYAYEWRRCDAAGANCAPIGGATSSAYLVVSADAGFTLRVAVIAGNAAGSTLAVSGQTAVVAVAPAPVSSTISTTFSGSLNRKQGSRSFGLTVGAGQVVASLSFGRLPALSLKVADANGVVLASASGPSIVRLVQSLPAGSYTFTVANLGGGSDSFSLGVTYSVS